MVFVLVKANKLSCMFICKSEVKKDLHVIPLKMLENKTLIPNPDEYIAPNVNLGVK